MCTAYSSLGNLQGHEDLNARLLVIYLVYQFNKKVPIVIHENVVGFMSDKMTELAYEFGYDHVSIRCKPKDVGVHVGRPRRCNMFLVTNTKKNSLAPLPWPEKFTPCSPNSSVQEYSNRVNFKIGFRIHISFS